MERFYLSKKYKDEFRNVGVKDVDLKKMEDLVSMGCENFGLDPKKLSYRIIFRERDWEVNVLTYYSVENYPMDVEKLDTLYRLLIDKDESRNNLLGVQFTTENKNGFKKIEDWKNSRRNQKMCKLRLFDIKFVTEKEFKREKVLVGKELENKELLRKIYGFRYFKHYHNNEWIEIIDEYNEKKRNHNNGFWLF